MYVPILVLAQRLHTEHNVRTRADVQVSRVSSGLQRSLRSSPTPLIPDHWPLQLEVVCPTDNLYWPKAASGKGIDDLATFPKGPSAVYQRQ